MCNVMKVRYASHWYLPMLVHIVIHIVLGNGFICHCIGHRRCFALTFKLFCHLVIYVLTVHYSIYTAGLSTGESARAPDPERTQQTWVHLVLANVCKLGYLHHHCKVTYQLRQVQAFLVNILIMQKGFLQFIRSSDGAHS